MRFFITILVFCNCLCSLAQTSVEQLRSKKNVESFVRSFYLKGEKKSATISYYTDSMFNQKWVDNDVRKYFKKNNKHLWIKKDFNSDGRLDLIWNGCVDAYSQVLGFISSGSTDYKCIELSKFFEKEAFNILHEYKENSIILTRIDSEKNDWDTSYKFKDRFFSDTIVYQNGCFTSLNSSAKKSIEYIAVKIFGYYVRTRDSLTIFKNGEAFLQRAEENDSVLYKVIYKKSLSKDSANDFIQMCESIPYHILKPFYEPIIFGQRHGTSFFIKVYFSDNSTFYIKDYMGSGPLAVRNVIEYLRKMRVATNWEIISKSEYAQ